MSKPHRFFNMYLTATMSVALVLLIIGLECVLLLSTDSLIRRVKENVTITLVLAANADTSAIAARLADTPYIHEATYISSAQALSEHITYLGEDPTKFLGYNPLRASYELRLNTAYTDTPTMQSIADEWSEVSGIERVNYQQELLSIINRNIHDLSFFLIAIALILLFIAVALIVNTIRLHIYSKRFLINTMTLVGATSWVIKAPIVRKNLWIGIGASVIASVLLATLLYYVHVRMGIALFELTWMNIGMIVGVIFAVGIVITTMASLAVTGHYIRMETNTMYEI